MRTQTSSRTNFYTTIMGTKNALFSEINQIWMIFWWKNQVSKTFSNIHFACHFWLMDDVAHRKHSTCKSQQTFFQFNNEIQVVLILWGFSEDLRWRSVQGLDPRKEGWQLWYWRFPQFLLRLALDEDKCRNHWLFRISSASDIFCLVTSYKSLA